LAGLYFEECEVGVVIKHEVTRTVTEADNTFFSCLTMNPQPLHLDEEFAKRTLHGQRLVNSIFTLGLVVGVSVADTILGTTLGNLGFEEVRFPNPVFHGDTIRAETEIISKRESRSRTDSGIVVFQHDGYNQREEIVCVCKRAALMLRKTQG
jgi:acyl dehydratase